MSSKPRKKERTKKDRPDILPEKHKKKNGKETVEKQG